ncbi:hypothetical protein BDV98DRAFT_570541 [Pterulicium gracile]|uniref:Uncharacterized protein n=1 Tax=Pterulicium gracile TaxID=1884261 RepID=A0A5C3QE64_9AGAR|nr:hypothetical protein BDV98DRAFT_570541 [Pterula gracilis]
MYLSPIHCLPDDILVIIFAILVGRESDKTASLKFCAPWTGAAVSKRWRAASLGTPQLWEKREVSLVPRLSHYAEECRKSDSATAIEGGKWTPLDLPGINNRRRCCPATAGFRSVAFHRAVLSVQSPGIETRRT